MSINFLRRGRREELGPEKIRAKEEEIRFRELKQRAADYFLTKDWYYLSKRNVSDNEESRKRAGEMLIEGTIDDRMKRKLMDRIQGPIELHGERRLFEGDEELGIEGIRGHKEEKILETVMGLEAGKATRWDLASFGSRYPTPVEFERKAKELREAAERDASPEECEQLEKDLDKFQRKVYGEQYEYHLAINGLEKDERKRKRMPEFDGPRRVHVEDLPPTLRVRPYPFGAEGEGEPDYGPSTAPVIDFPEEDGSSGVRRVRRAPELVVPGEGEGSIEGEDVSIDRERAGEGGRRISRMEARRRSEGLMTPEEGREIVEKAIIEGDELLVWNGDTLESQTVEKEDLLEAELEPKRAMKLEGVKYRFSEIFLVEGKREAVIGYIEIDGKVYARSYYRSGKDGMWRYLPDRKQDSKTGEITWYGVGGGEESLTLPAEVQDELNEQSLKREQKSEAELSDDEKRISDLRWRAFYGVSKAIDSSEAGYCDSRSHSPEKFGDALASEVSSSPSFELPDASTPADFLLPVGEDYMPDFEHEVLSSEGVSERCGHFVSRTFESVDGKMRWTMMEDDEGRVWFGQVEMLESDADKVQITSTGTRAKWVALGGFKTPLYEVPSLAGKYGDSSDAKMGVDAETGEEYVRYVSMWEKYLSKVPLIIGYKNRNAGKDDEEGRYGRYRRYGISRAPLIEERKAGDVRDDAAEEEKYGRYGRHVQRDEADGGK